MRKVIKRINFCGLIIVMPIFINFNTPKGDIRVRLYDETPLHRDNFVKLVGEGFYEGTLFHRVIRDFMIQGGDPDSKGAPKGKMLGTGGPGYDIPAEICCPKFYHKRGALCAARQADEANPDRKSSGSQFYLVYGKVYKLQQLKQMEQQMAMQREQQAFYRLVTDRRSEIIKLRKARDYGSLQELQDQLQKQAHEESAKMPAFTFSPEQIRDYTTIGGTPFLDGQYTVFGEVEEGLDVLDQLQRCDTDTADRPLEDLPVSVTVIQSK